MQFLDEREIFDLQFVGKGSYGSTYLMGNTIIKKYHKLYSSSFDDLYSNKVKLVVKYKRKKIILLLVRNQFIHNTNLINDVVFIKNKFSGVSYPYIDGDILDNYCKENILKKCNMSYQLVRNAKELTDFYIYPLDYKLNNILYDKSGNIQIIDLDDDYTKVTLMSNPIYLYFSLYSLRRTVINFLENDDVYNYFDYYANSDLNLSRYQLASEFRGKRIFSYYDIVDYINSRCQTINLTFVDCCNIDSSFNIDFSLLRHIQEFTFSKIVLCIDSEKIKTGDVIKYKSILVNVFRDNELDVYDILTCNDQGVISSVDSYLKRHNIGKFIVINCCIKQDASLDNECINFLNSKSGVEKVKKR